MSDADKNPKVKRWKLAIQGYDADWEYIKGPTNVIADPFSRLGWKEEFTKSGIANSLAALREVPHELQLIMQEHLNILGVSPRSMADGPQRANIAYTPCDRINSILNRRENFKSPLLLEKQLLKFTTR